MKSKLTGGETSYLFSFTVLGKYTVKYFQCVDTGFIQTEDPYWLEEAYSSAITKLDVGLVQRNLDLAKEVHPILNRHFDADASFLDYAGGYGLFTRLMRYRGFNFYNTDKYCENIFAEFQDLKYCKSETGFEVVTAFEVFEHLPDPLKEIEEMTRHGENILFSTVLVPDVVPEPGSWWYYSAETGQHIAFYTKRSLEYIAKKFNFHFYTNGSTLHLFTKKKLSRDPFKIPFGKKILRSVFKLFQSFERRVDGKRKNLMQHDIDEAKRKIVEEAAR